MANALEPGAGLHLTESASEVNTGLNTSALNAKDVITHAFPTVQVLVLKGLEGLS